MLPGLPYHVHDPARPHPPVVTPSTEPGGPPSDAIVLFDGKDLSKWTSAKLTPGVTPIAAPAPWKVENGYMEVVPGKGAIATKEKFGDVQLHVEWATPRSSHGKQPGPGKQRYFPSGTL